jgi:ATP-dependent RNA/DNA helicase IGHMBP2
MKDLKQLLACLKLEWDEDLRIYQNKVKNASLNQRRKEGFLWYPIKVTNHEIGTGGKLYITVEKPQANFENHVFQNGSPIALFANIEGEKDKPNETGVVSWVRKNLMKIVLSCEELPDWIDDGKLGVEILFDDRTYREMETALKEVAKAEKNRLADLRDVLTGLANPQQKTNMNKEIGNSYIKLPNLNNKQNEAVQKVLAAQDIAIIHGPPGTGKTTTLVEAIRLTLKQEKQVLVTAASNAAVDLLTEKLAAKGLKVLRLGNPARIDDNLLKYSLDEQLAQHPQFKEIKKMRKDAENYRQLATKYKRSFGAGEREQRKLLLQEVKNILRDSEKIEDYILDNLLNSVQVITATLIGTNSNILKNRRFSTVFIDEAAQALEPACWIPILKADKVVMAGDHCQLPPTVKSKEAEKAGLSYTLFEKIVAILKAKPDTEQHFYTMLEVQYRMHETIMEFSNQMFYGGLLKAAESVAHHTLNDNLLPTNTNFEPIINEVFEWIDTAGCGFIEKQDTESASLQNPEEASILLQHLTTLLAHFPNLADIQIGIISPYKAQVNLLNELIASHEVLRNHVEANTVDSFQGQERDIIYISLVRSNEEGEIGFLRDTRRMNVAMTRAKKKLVMIGDSATLGNNPFYEKLLSYIDRINAYKTAWEWIV